jgi:hypothetical protein
MDVYKNMLPEAGDRKKFKRAVMLSLARELKVGQVWRWVGGLADDHDTLIIKKIEKGSVHYEDMANNEDDFMEVFEFVYLWLQGYYVRE